MPACGDGAIGTLEQYVSAPTFPAGGVRVDGPPLGSAGVHPRLRRPYRCGVSDLWIEPAPGMPAGLVIPARELVERYSHASGPGGQGVNTTDSRVQLSFDIGASSALDPVQRERLLRVLRTRLAGTVLTVAAAEFRAQRRNRAAARERLARMLREGIAPPAPPRRRTRPTRSSVDRRLADKRRRGDLKRGRAGNAEQP